MILQALVRADTRWVNEANWNMLLMTSKVVMDLEMIEAYPACLMILSAVMIHMARWGSILQDLGVRVAKTKRRAQWLPLLPWNREPPDPVCEKEIQHRSRVIQKKHTGSKSVYKRAKRLSTKKMLLLGLQATQVTSACVPEITLSGRSALRGHLQKFRGSGGALITGKLNQEDLDRVRVTLTETAGLMGSNDDGFQVIIDSGCTKSAMPDLPDFERGRLKDLATPDGRYCRGSPSEQDGNSQARSVR
jgi:hypothetical protein